MSVTQVAPDTASEQREDEALWVYVVLGAVLGVIFIKSEVASWFRIQEMFRFQSIHMYGVIGSAIAVGATSIALMKRFEVRTIRGEAIQFPQAEDKRARTHHMVGGTIFGFGWGLLGACPGPIFALIGTGAWVMFVALLAASMGAWTYGWLRPRLPHG